MSELRDVERQKSFYDDRWQTPVAVGGAKVPRCAAILEALAATKIVHPRIADLGCGSGWLTNILATFGPTTGIDLSEVAVRSASERYRQAQFLAADILRWNYPRDAFDLVVSQEVIEHFDDQQAFVDVCHGLLKPGGCLILTTPNRWTSEAMSEAERSSYEPQPVEKWLTASELRRLLERRFHSVRVTTIVPGSGVTGWHRVMSSPRLRAAASRLGVGRMFDGLALRWGFGLHLFAVARKA